MSKVTRWEPLRGLNTSEMRKGQIEAVDVVCRGYATGVPTTSIVLPTRYGKSDTMRLVTLCLWRDGFLPVALALSPGLVLRNQLADKKRWNEAIIRYGFDLTKVPIRTLDYPEAYPNGNGECFLSATIQLVARNIDVFRKWVSWVIRETGKPPIIFIDECHTGSEENSWGALAEELMAEGAHVSLFTATAIRSDGKRIPGFETVTRREDPVIVTVTKPGSTPELVRVEIHEGVKRILELHADHTTTFQEAWDEKVICHVSRAPFDVDLSRVSDQKVESGLLLSQLTSTAQVRTALRCVRTLPVIREGARRLVEELTHLRVNTPETAAIVFCGNDDDKDDRAVNKHAEEIKREILRINPDLRVVIATSAEDGKDRLKDFANGIGDILIVKQMASLGLDIPRLKVGLDLSTVRAYASWVQRLMRIATIYKNFSKCIWIHPDDIISRALWEALVIAGHGEATATDLELVRAYEKEKKDSPEPDFYGVDGTALADFEDSELNRAKKEEWALVSAMLTAFPAILERYSHAQIAAQAKAVGIQVSEEAVEHGQRVIDTQDQTVVLRENINDLADEIAKMRVGIGEYSREDFGELMRDIYLRAYRSAGVAPGLQLKQITQVRVLEHILIALQDQLTDLGRKGVTR